VAWLIQTPVRPQTTLAVPVLSNATRGESNSATGPEIFEEVEKLAPELFEKLANTSYKGAAGVDRESGTAQVISIWLGWVGFTAICGWKAGKAGETVIAIAGEPKLVPLAELVERRNLIPAVLSTHARLRLPFASTTIVGKEALLAEFVVTFVMLKP
jgi:hypothetical protein